MRLFEKTIARQFVKPFAAHATENCRQGTTTAGPSTLPRSGRSRPELARVQTSGGAQVTRSERVARGADEFPQDGNVGAVNTDAAGVHGKSEALGEIQIDSCIVQFRQAVTLRGRDTIQA